MIKNVFEVDDLAEQILAAKIEFEWIEAIKT
jgi:hypothetical protein